MDAQYGLTCSSVNLREAPDPASRVVEALNPQEHVEVMDETGDMWQVQATRWQPPVSGYMLSSAVIVDEGNREIFPRVALSPEVSVPAVPPSTPLSTFLTWFELRPGVPVAARRLPG